MEVAGTVRGSFTKRAELLYTIAWEKVFAFSISSLTESEHFNILQFISSLASLQSTFWLHLLELEMHPPSLHWNWSAEHSVAVEHKNETRCLSTEKTSHESIGRNVFNQKTRLTVTKDFIGIVSAVVLPIAPGAMPHAATIHTPPVSLLAYTVGWEPHRKWCRLRLQMETYRMWLKLFWQKREKRPLTTVRLFLIRLVLAVGHAITSQGVVDTVSISTFKLIDVVTRGVEGWETKTEKCT